MKSAYELAMERLEKQSPTRQLTEAQKAAIAEIETATKAKIAEQELFLKDKISEAQAEGKIRGSRATRAATRARNPPRQRRCGSEKGKGAQRRLR